MKKERFASMLREKDISAAGLMDRLLSQVYTSKQLNKLLTLNTEKAMSHYNSLDQLQSSMPELDKMLAVDYKTYMVDDILVKVDRAAMSTSLEGREPLLDHRLVELAAQLPVHFKMNGAEKKYILKKIAHKYIPTSLMDRPKMGFGVPVHKWLQHELKFYVEEYMSDAAFAAHHIFRQEEIDLIKKRFYAGDKNYQGLFWYILMFQMWYKKWM
jgi:asparagine synthase (glutamine-hydrolysing)